MLNNKIIGSLSQASSGWDISTAQFNGSPINYQFLGSFEGSVTGVHFKPDGTKMYICGATGDEVNEFDLSTAWDISTLSHVRAFSVLSQDNSPASVFFSSDGTKMYVLGLQGDDVNQYTLSTAWNISTASYQKVFSVATQEANPSGLTFSSDGTFMYVTGTSADRVIQYTLTTAWDIGTASFTRSILPATRDTSPQGMYFKSDGTSLYVIGLGSDVVRQYSLSTAWDVSTLTYVRQYSYTSGFGEGTPTDVHFSSDGTKMYIVGSSTNRVHQFTLSTAWDISTATFQFPSSNFLKLFTFGSLTINPSSLRLKPDGTALFVTGAPSGVSTRVFSYALSEAWNLSTASESTQFNLSSQDLSPTSLFFKPDGSAMYVGGSTTDNVHQFTLTSLWDVSTANLLATQSVNLETALNGIYMSSDGLKLYVTGSASDRVHQYNLNTAWDLSAGFTGTVQNTSVSAQDTEPTDIFFDSTGTRMYISGGSADAVHQYSLSTPWDITTTSFVRSKSLAIQDTSPVGIHFDNTGTKMFVCGIAVPQVWSWDLD